MLDAHTGHNLSHTWKSLGVRDGLFKRVLDRWLVGDGYSINIWEDNWIPRPSSFKVITRFNTQFALLRVGDMITRDVGDKE